MSGLKIAASILSADFARLGPQVAEAERGGADWVHVDVMDGHFVPNLTFGPLAVEVARRSCTLPVDVHLMIEAPERSLDRFAEAGAHRITVHAEACRHLHRVVQQIRETGVAPGVAINPATPLGALEEILSYTDLVLVMSVDPGFGGQPYIDTTTDKIARLRAMLDERGLSRVELQVDGGISPATISAVARAGASVVVAGSAVFGGAGTVEQNVRALRQAAHGETEPGW